MVPETQNGAAETTLGTVSYIFDFVQCEVVQTLTCASIAESPPPTGLSMSPAGSRLI